VAVTLVAIAVVAVVVTLVAVAVVAKNEVRQPGPPLARPIHNILQNTMNIPVSRRIRATAICTALIAIGTGMVIDAIEDLMRQ